MAASQANRGHSQRAFKQKFCRDIRGALAVLGVEPLDDVPVRERSARACHQSRDVLCELRSQRYC
jgi:hypothetical protein